ncbi:MAG TPA: DNA polymerase III subunit alpha [Candidatus Ornithocaccomicrobium faecavium]|uniref:DNA polymerase III subunit alpha n=1 Tax=Candidatus Ornithocaccomicrobium faecavium TaxID=2840890 RepID=A0A9D1PAA3_9FIRM|nr:DNA polymerase III subunit alpha [Candidatus Ornithocaccomicrobium faecavium]
MFAHLHLHTQYSLLDGAASIDPLMERLKALGMTACAITDHGVMYGVVEFYQAAKKAGIHPVIGCEVYVCPNMDDRLSGARDYNHLILLAENDEGYHNLTKLVSEGFTRGFYYKPRVDYDLLRRYAKGLIALSACISGELPQLLLNGRREAARESVKKHLEIFGEGNYFIEIQDHGLAEQKQVLPELVALSREMGVPLVATNDCHYLTEEDARAQEVLMCIQTGKTLSDENRMRMETDQLYVKSEEEMRRVFPAFPEAIENTQKIAERCRVDFDFHTLHLPKYPLPEGQDAFETLRALCEEGLKERYPQDNAQARERLEYELDVIRSMGYVDYFLIVWDFIRYARKNGILVGPGRGSGAGSIVAYTLNITGIDPLKYNLLFERFLNPERVSMPDLDIDFDYERRGEVIAYVADKYGADHVAQIITFGTMAARGVLRDVGRVMGMSYPEVDRIAKMVPFALDMTLERALKQNPELHAAYETEERVRELIDTAQKLEGMPRHASTHAAGVLITPKPVSDYVPLQTNDAVITTQFPMTTLESLGLLKMDFLGLRTLNVIGDSLDMMRAEGKADMRPEDIPMDDPAVYALIASGDTDGIFQLEGGGMRQFLQTMQPENFEDIIAAVSLYRPGPMDSIPRYIRGKHDPASVTYITPKLKPILDVTYGCMVYQEQVMQIVRDLAGYSLGRSDLVRKAMAKKKHDVMAQEKENFIHGVVKDDGAVEIPGAVRMGVSEEAAEQIYDEMAAFASYAFNKSHAAAYARVAVETAWLKKYYPVEFMAALMNSVSTNTDKVAFYIQSCGRMGIRILPPDINRSNAKFSVEDGCIRFGLQAVKSVGGGAIAFIEANRREKGPFRDLFDYAARVPGEAVNKKAVESLIRAGAMDSLPGSRAQKLAAFDRAMDAASKRAHGAVEGQLSLFDALEEEPHEAPKLPDVAEFPRREMLAMEKEVTGVYITGHPLDEYRAQLDALETSSRTLRALEEESEDHGLQYDQLPVTMGGMVSAVKTKVTKNDQIMAFVQLEDLYGATEVLVFPRVYERYRSVLLGDSVVLLNGRLSVREDEAPKLILESARALGQGVSETPAPEAYLSPAREAPRPVPEKRPARMLYLKLDRARFDRALSLLALTPGPIPVTLRLADENRTLRAPQNYSVRADFNRVALEELLGAENVVMK